MFNKLLSIQKRQISTDVAILGGGIIGTAIARELSKSKDLKIHLIDKEPTLAKHQSSHNSGVIHSGLYYKPESLKAQLCAKGANEIINYCNLKGIPIRKSGKLIIATTVCEAEVLNQIYKLGLCNRVPGLKLIYGNELRDLAPDCDGLRALFSPSTANVDWEVVTQEFAKDFVANGGEVLLKFEVERLEESKGAILINNCVEAKFLIVCPGLQSDLFAKMLGATSNLKTIPFWVEYKLIEANILKEVPNIYVVPKLDRPFLGAHLSPKIDGQVLFGPTALPCLKLEGYDENEINLGFVKETISNCSFQKMVAKNLRESICQVEKHFCINTQVDELKKIVPKLEAGCIKKGPVAVQAQMLDENGNFLDDFIIDYCTGASNLQKRTIFCRFMPSPAATSSMAIAELVADNFNKYYKKLVK